MSNDRQAKMLERVRALLAKADSTNFAEEADAFRQKADQLMTDYAIEQWMVEEAQDAISGRPVPERRDYNFDWYGRSPFKDQLWALMLATARHCRCVIVGRKVSWSDATIPVLGLASDLAWFDLLFTNLMLAMGRQVDPPADARLSLEENMAAMREAGMPWEEALNRLVSAGILPSAADQGERPKVMKRPTKFSAKTYETAIRKYRAWCKKTGHPQSYVNQNTFRRNFCDGFAAEIADRFCVMRRESEAHYDKTHEAGSMAIAVRDIESVIQEMVYEIWPDLKPHPRDCQCDKCRRLRAQMRKPTRYKQDKRPIDHSAIEAGRQAGRKVDLQNNPDRRVRATPEIGR